jgi:hypothetical protein
VQLQNSCASKRADFLSPELPAIDAFFAKDRIGEIVRPLRLLISEDRGARDPVFPLDRETLRNRRALRQYAAEIRVVPMRREMNPGVVVVVAIDQTGQGGERQVEAIDRMGEQQRVAFGRLDGPEIVEFDEVAVGVEQRRAGDLAGIVESDRRAQEADFSAGRRVVVPGEFAVLDLHVTNQRDQKARCHGVDEWRTALDRVVLAEKHRIERLRRHRLEPVGQTRHGRHRRRQ